MFNLRRILSIFALAGITFLVPAAAAPPSPPAGPESLLHHRAPRFVRSDLGQKRIDLASYRGKVVLLNFWATWCAPCQIEMPRFAEWQKTFGPRGLQVIAVSMDDGPEPVQAYVRRRTLPFPVLMGDNKLGKLYGGILGLPITFLIDRRGVVAAEFKGEPRLEQMESILRHLLDDPKP